MFVGGGVLRVLAQAAAAEEAAKKAAEEAAKKRAEEEAAARKKAEDDKVALASLAPPTDSSCTGTNTETHMMRKRASMRARTRGMLELRAGSASVLRVQV